MSEKLILSSLGHTWIFDIDGTLVKHNGYKIDGKDTLLPGVSEFFKENIREEDFVLLLTARSLEYKNITEEFLKMNEIKFDVVLYNMPYGERILINDRKPSGLDMSHKVNFDRNIFDLEVLIDNKI